jgi:hypothetical protein
MCLCALCSLVGDCSVQAELQNNVSESGTGEKSGVCLEFLKGTCERGLTCSFSHSLQEYYCQVCKRHPYVSVSRQSIAESLCSTAGNDGGTGQECPADMCLRSYLLRCVIPVLFPGQPKRAEAFIAALVTYLAHSSACLLSW